MKNIFTISFAILSQFVIAQPQFQWAINLGGVNSDYGAVIAADRNGNVVNCGQFVGTVDFDPGAGVTTLISTGTGNTDIYITKYDGSGNFIWAKQFSGLGPESAFSMVIDSIGNIFIAGSFNGTTDFNPGPATSNLIANGNTAAFVVKLTESGDFVWAKEMGPTGTSVGIASGIAIDNAGNIYTTGYFNGAGDFDPGAGTFTLTSGASNSGYITKFDPSGNFIWAKQIGDGASGNNVYSYGIVLDAAANIYTTGGFVHTVDFDPGSNVSSMTTTGSFQDAYILKLDSGGNYRWSKQLGGSYDELAYSIALDASANVYTTGVLISSQADFDPGSGTYYLSSFGSLDIYVSKLNSNGDFVWARQLGGTLNDTPNSIAVDDSGAVYTTGFYTGTADFNPDTIAQDLLITGATNRDLFLSKLDSAGNYSWAQEMGGTSDDRGTKVSLDHNYNIYLTGYFNGTEDLDFSAGSFPLTSHGNYDAFLLKIGSPFSGINSINRQNTISIYPNPALDKFSINILNSQDIAKIEIIDNRGRLIEVRTEISSMNTFDIKNNSPGIYFLKLMNRDGTAVFRKMVKLN